MNIKELYKTLKDLKIPESKYYLQGIYGSTNDEGKLSLIVKSDKYKLEYEVYYKERGEKNSIQIFTSEDEACQYFYKRLKEAKEIEDKYSR